MPKKKEKAKQAQTDDEIDIQKYLGLQVDSVGEERKSGRQWMGRTTMW